MTFQVTIMFGLGFMRGFFRLFLNFYYDRLIGILFIGFLAANFKLEFELEFEDFRIRPSDFKFQKSPLSFSTFI